MKTAGTNLAHCYICQKFIDAKYLGLCSQTICAKPVKKTNTEMPINITADEELLKLIYDDLKMRADDGVVNISGFIWDRLSKRVLDT